MPSNFAKISDNIYRGGEPTQRELEMLRDVYGIKRVISLDAGVAQRIAPFLKQNKIEHIVNGLTGSETGWTDTLTKLYRNVVPWLSGSQPSYVHCIYGSDRTGLAAALYRVKREGMPCKQAMAEAKKYQFGQRISPATQKLYEMIICGELDQNSIDDISQQMMDDHLFGQDHANSFSLPGGLRNEITTDEFKNNRIERKQKLQDILDEIPIVGQLDYSGSQGAGYIEPGTNILPY